MKYMMFVAIDPDGGDTSDEPEADMSRTGLPVTMPAEHGCSASGCGPADATTVRRRNGEVLVTDGPFAESREWIVGFDILDCADLDEAIAIAAQRPMAHGGRLELRPFWEDGRTGHGAA